ncbi:hypothetical protein D3C78_456200 [compost metagenome]
MAIGCDEVIGRHLVAVPDHAVDDGLHLAFVHATVHRHVARKHHAHETRVVAQLVQAVADELVDVAVVVGQQYPRLHMAPVTAGVMHQAAQGEVHPRGIEQRQGQRIGVFPFIEAVGDAVGGGGQIGAREHPGQLGGGHPGTGQFVAVLHHIGIGNVLPAGAHFNLHGEVMHQRPQLLQQVGAESVRVGDGDTVVARHLDLGIGAGGGRHLALAPVGDAQQRVAEQRALCGVRLDAFLDVALQRQAEGTGGLLVQFGESIDGFLSGFGNHKISRFEAHERHPVCSQCPYLAC